MQSRLDSAVVTQVVHYMIAGALNVVEPGNSVTIGSRMDQDGPVVLLTVRGAGDDAKVSKDPASLVSKRLERIARHGGFGVTTVNNGPDGISLACALYDVRAMAVRDRREEETVYGGNVSRLPPPTNR